MPQGLRSSALLVASIVALLSISSRDAITQSGTPSYGINDLGTLGGATAQALYIDPSGFTVLGSSATASGDVHAFNGGVGRSLTDLGTLGGRGSEARSANYGSDIVGRSQVASGAWHGFWQQYVGGANYVLRDLGTLGGSQSTAEGVALVQTGPSSYKRMIVGSSSTSSGLTRAVVYDTDAGTMTDLGATLGGAQTAATAVNANMHVVGWAETNVSTPDGIVSHAFMYANGTTTDLGSFGASSTARAINDSDVIVGDSEYIQRGISHAFRYQSGAMQDLGTLGGGYSSALAVNRDGVIVGWAQANDSSPHAFIWENGVMTDLNTLIASGSGWVLQAATSISNGASGRAAIVGYGLHNGQTRAFFLTPPIDLYGSIRVHLNDEDTNFPNPHEAGQWIPMGFTVFNNSPFNATNVIVTQTFTGAVELGGYDTSMCTQSGLQVTCKLPFVSGAGWGKDVMLSMRATGPGNITHSAQIVSADQPDPNTANNSGGPESNTAVSLASLTLATSSAQGGSSVLGRATITNPAPQGDARVTLTSSNPDVASVPSPFDVLAGCCDNGTYREFYVSTKPVSAPVTVQISATYGLVTKTVPLTITPGSSSTPFGGSARTIPGTIQAEDFDEGGEGVAYHDNSAGNSGGAYRSTDVDIETTGDVGGGYDVGWMTAGEWMNYSVNVSQTGTYLLTARVAASGAGGTFHVEFGGTNKTGTLTIPNTGGWQAWTDTSVLVSLSAGVQTMRFVADTNGAVFGNLNYLQLSAQSSGGGGGLSPFSGSPAPVPGPILAANFDNGGEGVAYHDTDAGNNGGAYRSTDVDIEKASDGGFDVGWIAAGEWLKYTVNVAAAGNYNATFRVASPNSATLHFSLNAASGAVSVPATGGWQNWTNIIVPMTLQAGTQVMTLTFDTGGMNIEAVSFVAASSGGSGGLSPFSGAPALLPGQIPAAYFDNGGEGVAYHDTTAGNTGGAYRNTDVDLEVSSEGGYDVGWVAAGEWLNYTVNVSASGSYTVQLRVASPGGATLHVGFNGPSAGTWKSVSIPASGGWQNWTTVSVPVTLGGGAQQMTIYFDTGGMNFLWTKVQ
jgi:probable HAF family extracellular repeat protein